MSYTVAMLEDVHNNLTINFDKVGNKYLVGISNTAIFEYTHKTYDTASEAYSVFEKLSKAIIMSHYTYEQRKEFLTA